MKKSFKKVFTIMTALFLILSLAIPTNLVFAQTNTEYEPENPGVLDEQTAEGDYGMVVSAHPLASKVGAEVLKNGGNAVDAAVAVQIALNVVEPQMSGIGGGGFFMYYDAETEDVSIINSREKAPSGATPELFIDIDSVVEGKGKFLFGANELNNDGGGQFHLGEVYVYDLDQDGNDPVFSYKFDGELGAEWDSEKFDLRDTGTTLTLDEDGGLIDFGGAKTEGEKRSFAQVKANMGDIENGELKIRFRTDTPGNDRRMRFYLRTDDFRSTGSTYAQNGYGIEIDTKANQIKLLQLKDGSLSTLETITKESTTDWQWLKFQVDGLDLRAVTWKAGEDEPTSWDIERSAGKVIPFQERVQSGLSVGVPGTLKGLEEALDKWGTKSLAELIEPSIELAEGHEINWSVASAIESNATKLSKTAARDVFLDENGEPLEEGDILVQKDLAKTLRLIQEHGTDVFYKGEIADALVEEVQKRGGPMVKEDLENYDIAYHNPVWGTFMGYDIASMPPPSSGGITMLQILKMLEMINISQFDIRSLEKYHNLVEIYHLAYADRAKYIGDPEYVDVPQDGMLNDDYLAKRVQTIDSKKANDNVQAGDPWKYESGEVKISENTSSEVNDDDKVDGETTHFTVADRWGNLVSYTTTIEQVFGSGIMVPGYGILLNNELTDFDAVPGGANQVEANKRPLSSMTPTIVLEDGKPFMTVGSPGGTTIITSVAQTILNVIAYEQDLKYAIEEPRVFSSAYPSIRWEYGVPDAIRDKMEEMGHVWEDSPREIGNVNSILLKDGIYYGAADSTRQGTAIGLSSYDFVTKDELQNLVDELKAKDLDKSLFTEDSWKDFTEALENAQEVLANEEATQEEVDNALNRLNETYGNLKDKPKEPEEVNKEKLKNKIDEIKGQNLDESKYTEESWKALKEALKLAEAVLTDKDAIQEDVDEALKKLIKAREGLELASTNDKDDDKVDKDKTTPSRGEDDDGKTLPKTATQMYAFILLGTLLLVIGASMYFIKRRQNN